MSGRSCLKALLLAGIFLPLTSCINDNPSLTSIVIMPNGVTAALGTCGYPQVVTGLKAIGHYSHPGHADITKDITDEVTWYSFNTGMVAFLDPTNNPGVATVTTCADPTVPGNIYTTLITASAPGFHGLVTGEITFGVQEPPKPTT
jgi:hypothetical protein